MSTDTFTATDPLAAVKTVLESLGYPVFIDVNPGPVTPPYLVVAGPGDGRPDEEPLAGPRRDTASDMRITAVFGTPEGARIGLARVLAILSPAKQTATVAPGVFTRFVRREVVAVDTSVVITGTNRSPGYGVDTYRLIAEGIADASA